MKRLCFIMLGFACTAAVADAQSLSVQRKTAHAYAKEATVATASRNGSLVVNFSNPYAPPVGTGKAAAARFPAMLTDEPVEPQGGMSFTAGRNAPDEPMTGGLKLSF